MDAFRCSRGPRCGAASKPEDGARVRRDALRSRDARTRRKGCALVGRVRPRRAPRNSAEILDFKTDRVVDADIHRPQMQIYRRALARIEALDEVSIATTRSSSSAVTPSSASTWNPAGAGSGSEEAERRDEPRSRRSPPPRAATARRSSPRRTARARSRARSGSFRRPRASCARSRPDGCPSRRRRRARGAGPGSGARPWRSRRGVR